MTNIADYIVALKVYGNILCWASFTWLAVLVKWSLTTIVPQRVVKSAEKTTFVNDLYRGVSLQ